MPTTISYQPDEQIVKVGAGVWGPISREAFDYVVGGRSVVKAWFNYRKADPTGRRASPLDDIRAEAWSPEWSIELTDLLTVLTRLVDAEDAQADLLARILAKPLLQAETLRNDGVRWPRGAADRRPKFAVRPERPDAGDGVLPFG
jgi:hypothetical protein